MPRQILTDKQTGTHVVQGVYAGISIGENTTIGELLETLKDLELNRQETGDQPSVIAAIKEIFESYGWGWKENAGWRELRERINVFRTSEEKTVRQILEEASQIHIDEAEKAHEFDSKLDEAKIKELLDVYEKYREFQKTEDLVREAKKNPLLAMVSESLLRQTIEQKVRLEKEAADKGLSEIAANEVSNSEITLKNRLENEGIEKHRAEEIAEKAAYIQADSLDEAGKKFQDVFKNETIERKAVAIALDQVLSATAEATLEKAEEEIANKFVNDFDQKVQLGDRKQEVKKMVKDRIREQVDNSLPKLTENKNFTKDGKTSSFDLSAEAIKISGFDDRNFLDPKAAELKVMVDNLILAKAKEVEQHRREVMIQEINKELQIKGEETRTATKTANTLGNMVYPKGSDGQTIIITERAATVAISKGYRGVQLELAHSQANFFVNGLILSPRSIEDSLKILRNAPNIDSKEIKIWQITANTLNEKTIRSIDYIKSELRFKKLVDTFTGRGVAAAGRTFNVKSWEEWGVRRENRVDTIQWGDEMGALATWLNYAQIHKDQYGTNIDWAAERASYSWLENGTINPIGSMQNFGGLVNNKLFSGFKGLGELGNNLLSNGNILLKKGGLNTATLLKSLVAKFPQLAGLAVKAGSGPVGWVLAIKNINLKEVGTSLGLALVGVIGGLVLLPMLMFEPQISSVVPTTNGGPGQSINKPNVDVNGNPVLPDGPGLPAGTVSGKCSVADVVVSQPILQTGSVGNMDPNFVLKTGEPLYSVACGPTSLAMILERFSEKYSPRWLYENYPPLSDQTGGSWVYQDVAVLRDVLNKIGRGNVGITDGGCKNAEDIANYICAGKLVLMASDFVQPDHSLSGHFYLAVGVDNGIIQRMDPYPPYSMGKTNVFDGLGTPGSVIMGDKNFDCTVIDADKLR